MPALNQIQGWTIVRESYSRALQQGPLWATRLGEPKVASTGREHEFFTESSGDRENYAAGIRGIGPTKREGGEISGNSFETEKYSLI